MNMNTMKVMRHGSIKLIIQKVFAHSYLSSFRLRSSLSIPHPSHWHPYLFFHTHWSILDKDQANRKEILGVGVQYDHYWRHVAIPMSYNFCPYHTHFDADMDLGSSYKQPPRDIHSTSFHIKMYKSSQLTSISIRTRENEKVQSQVKA